MSPVADNWESCHVAQELNILPVYPGSANDGSKSYFNFYNNEIASAVSTELSAKQYDNIPIQSKALSYVKNKLIDANVKLNFDAPDCINATITQNIEEKPQQKFLK